MVPRNRATAVVSLVLSWPLWVGGAASAADDAVAAAIARLRRADLGEVDSARSALEKAAAGSAGAAVIDALAQLLDDHTRVRLENTADLFWPGAKESFGHGRYLDYDVDLIAIRAGWVIETITFRDFGFRGFELDREGAKARRGTERFRAWWTKDVAATWMRYQALKDALASESAVEQGDALVYLRFGEVGCAGLDATSFAADLASRISDLAKSSNQDVRLQAELLLREGSAVAGTSTRRSWTTTKIPAGLSFSVPTTWTSVAVKSSMRQAQFQLTTQADSEAPELVVYYFGPNGGGGVEANHARWRGQFAPNDGKDAIEEKATRKKVNGLEVDLLEIGGRFVAETAPGSGVRVDKPNFRMLSAIVPSKQGLVYFKLVGPNDAVVAQRAEFDTLIDSLVDG